MCINATNYEGSPLQAMLDGSDSIGDGAMVGGEDTPEAAEASEGKSAPTAEKTAPSTNTDDASSVTVSPSEGEEPVSEADEIDALLAEAGI